MEVQGFNSQQRVEEVERDNDALRAECNRLADIIESRKEEE